jgi:alkylation response protein AidB-like acyl-CoA dehydrogenase
MAAVLGGEVAEEFGETLLELFGPEIALAGGAGWPDRIEQLLRLSVMYVVGGGTNDVQRGMIARALGLPR